MTTFTELVAAVVVQSSTLVYSHFGVTLEPVRVDPPAVVERVVVRRDVPAAAKKADKTLERPAPPPVRVAKA